MLKSFLFRWTCHYSWTHVNFQSQIQRCGSSYKSKRYINQNLIVATGPQRQNIWFIDKFWKYSRAPVTRTLKGNEKQFELAGNSSYPSSSYRRSTVTESVHFSPSCKATYGKKKMRKQTIFLYVPLILFKIGDKMANKRRRTYLSLFSCTVFFANSVSHRGPCTCIAICMVA